VSGISGMLEMVIDKTVFIFAIFLISSNLSKAFSETSKWYRDYKYGKGVLILFKAFVLRLIDFNKGRSSKSLKSVIWFSSAISSSNWGQFLIPFKFFI